MPTAPAPTNAQARLFCLPYAGGGAAIYKGWAPLAPPALQIAAVQLPGREHRLAEPAFSGLETLVPSLLEGIRTHLDRPFAIFGHSMGALIAFELARTLRRRELPSPAHLFLSGHRAPHLPDRRPPIHALPDAEFWPALRKLGGTPDEVFAHPELMALIEPALRADFQLCETYAWREEPPLDIPLSVFGGSDDPNVERSELEAWRDVTRGPVTVEMLPGDHHYLHQAQRLVSAVALSFPACANF